MANEKRLIYSGEIYELFYKQVEYGATDLMDAFEDALEDAQTVDAVEVVHGRWVEDTAYDTIACTECGHMWNTIDNCTETFNYCPNCGAKMDGERKDNGKQEG